MKRFAAGLVIFFTIFQVFALDVDKNELRIDPSIKIRFENYEGVPAKVETLEQIRGIGAALGKALNDNPSSGRYRVIHAVDPKTASGFDADIFILEKGAAVDHIRNLRFILSGFLGAAYGYTERDSLLLAEFITVYNAVHRKDLAYFRMKLKALAFGYLSADKAGLALSFKEWPGATEMVIPLSDAKKGSLSAVDTGQITAPKVVEELKTRDDKGLEIRKEMIELKERQVDQEEKKLQETKQTVQQEEKKLAVREAEVKKEEVKLREEKQALGEEKTAKKEEGTAKDSNTKETASAQVQKEEVAKKEELVNQERKKLEDEKKDLEKKRDEIVRKEEAVEQKKEEIRQERKEVAKDQQEVLNKEGAAVLGLPFIKTEGSGGGRLVLVNPKTGEVLNVSSDSPLAVRNMESFGTGLAVVLDKNGTGRLAVVDSATLKEKSSAREEIGKTSLFKVNGKELFAVLQDGGKWYLGKYDAALSLIARSRTEIDPNTFMVFSDVFVYVQTSDGKIAPLKLQSMD